MITFGGRDLCTSTRFAPALTAGIPDNTLVVFDDLSHAGLHEDPETFNKASLDFLLAQRM
ncbi:MAG: alpha/beta fold hydrolase [Actinomycetes bacterium]